MDPITTELRNKIYNLEIQKNECSVHADKLREKLLSHNETINELTQELKNQENIYKEEFNRKAADFFSLIGNATNMIQRINKTRNEMVENIDGAIKTFQDEVLDYYIKILANQNEIIFK